METVDLHTYMERMAGRRGDARCMGSAEPKACRQEGRCHIRRSLARQMWLDHRCNDVHMRWGMCKSSVS